MCALCVFVLCYAVSPNTATEHRVRVHSMSVFFVMLCLPVQQQSSGYVYTLCSLLRCVTQYSNGAHGMCTLYVCVLCYGLIPSAATELRVCVHFMSVFFVRLCLCTPFVACYAVEPCIAIHLRVCVLYVLFIVLCS